MLKNLSMIFAATMAVAMTACANDDMLTDAATQADDVNDSASVYVQLTFNLSSTSYSRADAYDAGEAESSGNYAVGNDYESKINSIYLYFFKKQSDNTYAPVRLSDESGKEYYAEYSAAKIGLSSTTEANASASSGKAVAWVSRVVQLPEALSVGATYRVYALCNKPYTGAISSEQDLIESTLSIDEDENAIVNTVNNTSQLSQNKMCMPMAARSYGGALYQELTPTVRNTESNPCSLTFEMERTYARIAFMDHDYSNFNVYKTTSSDEIIGKAQIIGYRVVNRAKSCYTYRHVGSIDESTYATTIPTAVGTKFSAVTEDNPYVIAANTAGRTAGTLCTDFYDRLSDTRSADVNNITDSQFRYINAATYNSDRTTQPNSVAYVGENTMARDLQLKGQSTGIIFMVSFHFADDTQKSQYLVDSEGTWQQGNDLYYCDGKFYASIADLKSSKNAAITAKNLDYYGVKYFKGGIAYYEYFIRHLNNNDDTEMGVMEFAIVRNNSYELTVSRISMAPYTSLPGDPDPTDAPDPTDPDESNKIYLQMSVNVRPWTVQYTKVNLGK